MPHLPHEPHAGRTKRIVFGELQLGGEDPPLVGRALGALDQCFPEEDVVFAYGTGGYSVGGRLGEELVFVEEAFRGYG